jgi:hypothetical protein
MSWKRIAATITITTAVMWGCGDDPVDPPPPADKYCSVRGNVQTTIGANVEGAAIRVVDGGSNTLNTTTDVDGNYQLNSVVISDVTTRIIVPVGYSAASNTLVTSTCAEGDTLIVDFVLLQEPDTASVAIGTVKDNTLYEYVPVGIASDTLFSNGAGSQMFAGKTAGGAGFGGDVPRIRRGLIQFDLSPVPSGSTIDSVCLFLRGLKRKNNDPVSFGLHGVSVDWGEGTSFPFGGEGAGTTPSDGDATWLHTFYDLVTPTSWTTPGGDYAPVASATTEVTTLNVTYKWGSTVAMVNDVQGWLDTPATNYGWAIVGGEALTDSLTAKGFGTKENSTESNRPRLKVFYTKP